MANLVFLLGVCFLFTAIHAHPAVDEDVAQALESKVRDKRKINIVPETEANGLDTLPETKILESPAELPKKEEEEVKKEIEGAELLDPVKESEGEAAERVKKQACMAMPQLSQCAEISSASSRSADHGQVLMEVHHQPVMKAARTLEPILSFGPLHLNGAGAAAYGGGSSGYPVRGSSAGYGYPYAPGGLQLNAMIPMPVPLLHHHSLNIQHEPVMYMNAPEPIYVAPSTSYEAPTHQHAPVSLYCEGLSKKEGKSLPTPEERANLTEEAAAMNEHIQRVNDIKEEISALNTAAQRIVDLQEKNSRMHQDSIAMLAAKNSEYPSHLSHLAPLLRHQESQMRVPPYHGYGGGYGGYMRPPYFKSADEEVATAAPATEKPEETTAQPHQHYRAPDDYMRQGFYPSYGGYYGNTYRASDGNYYPIADQPAYTRSETGFNVQPMFKSAANPPTATPEEAREFFARMFEMGQKMGLLSKDYQPGASAKSDKKESEITTQPEDALSDLMMGGTPKSQKPDQPSKIDMGAEIKKKDKRALVMKNF